MQYKILSIVVQGIHSHARKVHQHQKIWCNWNQKVDCLFVPTVQHAKTRFNQLQVFQCSKAKVGYYSSLQLANWRRKVPLLEILKRCWSLQKLNIQSGWRNLEVGLNINYALFIQNSKGLGFSYMAKDAFTLVRQTNPFLFMNLILFNLDSSLHCRFKRKTYEWFKVDLQ